MKSFVLKDLYNISHNAKSLFFMLLMFAFLFIPLYGPESYIVTSGLLCSMMIVTTFSFDEMSKWNQFAMVMPVSRKDLVAGKFVTLWIFSGFGVLCGAAAGSIGGLLLYQVSLAPETLGTVLLMLPPGLAAAAVFGSLSIPLIFRYGAEKARILLMISIAVPALAAFGIYKLIPLLHITLTEQTGMLLLCLSPAAALVWSYLMYRISCAVFEKQEL